MGDEKRKKVTPLVLQYVLPNDWSDAEKDANPISAGEVVDAIKGGKRVEIINAVIEGSFILKSVNVEGEVTIQGTKIGGRVDWSYATFKHVLILENSLFENDAIFTAAAFEKDIFLDGATFLGKAEFYDITVAGIFYSRSVAFKQLADFNSAKIEGPAFFMWATFEGEAYFQAVRIGERAEFGGATFKQLATFESAQVEGTAFFNPITFIGEERSVIFEGEANFAAAKIGGNAEFNRALFKQLADFNSAKIEGPAFFISATFEGVADFVAAQIGGVADFRGATFKQLATFNIAEIERHAFFKSAYLFSWEKIPGTDNGRLTEFLTQNFGIEWVKAAKIEKNDDLKTIRVTSEKNFLSLSLNDEKTNVNLEIDDGKTDKFIVKTENGELNICKSATFEGKADFGTAQIGGDAEFIEAQFKQLADFNSTKIEGRAFFKSAIFEGKANFVAAQIGGVVEFDKALFKQLATFDSAQFEKYARFNSVIFEGKADFESASIIGDAKFTGAKFNQLANFNSAKIAGDSYFTETVFASNIVFQDTLFGTIFFGENGEAKTKFQAKYLFSWDEIPGNDNGSIVKFLNQNFGIDWVETAKIEKIDGDKTIKVSTEKNSLSLKLNNEKTRVDLKIDDGKTDGFIAMTENGKLNIYQAKIDLRGCKYDRINPTSIWKQLMDRLYPYDRQPFTHLEETFRQAGLDELANDVYYMRKRQESAQKNLQKNPGAWLMDRFLWLLTGYGVRLKRLLLFIVPLLIIGTLIFTLEGAVEPAIQSPWDAFWVSFRTFLPVEIPSGADWIPSSNFIQLLGVRFTTFATILKLAGWILVPVGVAGISGLLKR